MANYIRRVVLKGLFEKQNNYTINFESGANCIFGDNGSGKTTIINLIVNSLQVDILALSRIPFESISIKCSKFGQTKVQNLFTVTKKINKVEDYHNIIELKYTHVDLDKPAEFRINSRRRPSLELERHNLKIKKLKDSLTPYINLTHVPLLRIHDSELVKNDDYDGIVHNALRRRQFSSSQILEILDPSVRVLTSLEEQFVDKMNNLRKIVNSNLENFKSQIIEKIMINSNMLKEKSKASKKKGKEAVKEIEGIDIDLYEKKFSDINISVPKEKVEDHFNTWVAVNRDYSESLEHYSKLTSEKRKGKGKGKKEKEAIDKFVLSIDNLNAVTPFHEKFLSIVQDIENMQKEKNALFKVFTDYKRVVNEFLRNKNFSLTEDGRFKIEHGNRPISFKKLSSGEKHIITILGRASLSGDIGSVFVADEPELSLHLEWQRMIIPSIMELSPKTQVIVATHSPAIIPNNTAEIDLEDCR